MFSQGQVDKRGIRVLKDGKPVLLSQLRAGDKLSAVIITEGPPQVLTEKEIQATLAAPPPAAAPAGPAGAPATEPAAGSAAATPAPAGAEPAAPAPAEPATDTAATPAPATDAAAEARATEGGMSWLTWGALIVIVLIVLFFLFRRSGPGA